MVELTIERKAGKVFCRSESLNRAKLKAPPQYAEDAR